MTFGLSALHYEKSASRVLKPVRNGTRADILDAIERYTRRLNKAGPDAIGFIYYSGHGISSKGVNYLLPVELTRPSSGQLRAYGIKQNEVLSILRKDAPAAAHYFVIDACRNELQGTEKGAKGFVAVNQQRGTLIAFATAPGQTASDEGSGSGPYAKALAAELIKPGVTDIQMFSNVRFAVSSATSGDQVPWTWDGIVRRDRVMFGGQRSSNASTAGRAAAAWEQVKASKDPNRLRAFAKRYPGTVYAQIAMLTADKLAAVAPSKPRNAPEEPTTSKTARLQPGTTFKDCDVCPELVVVPAGNFTMGSPANEPSRGKDETPVPVSIAKPFAVGKFEVTFAEWDACVADGGCRHKPSDRGWGRGKQPVMNVSWNDISKQYLPWLSRKTGKRYRLLSEAEWEYVARAGTTSPFWWGSSITSKQANYDGNFVYKGGGSKGEYRKRTMPVNSFQPNPWGLYNVHGNVWEWTQDCWNGGNSGNPGDGSARTTGNCNGRVLRGGSWNYLARYLRSAYRVGILPGDRGDYVGFRVVRMLTP